MTSSDMIIEAERLTCRFGDVVAVDDLSLGVAAGSVFGFLGPNGAGKTTTIRLLLGLVPPSSGRARVCGLDVTTRATEVRAQVGALLEHTGVYERLTPLENLEFYARLHMTSRDERRTRIAELLRRFGLWERREERAGNLSRGMKQRLAIARALLHRPRLVFLDEPAAGLDPAASVELRETVRALARDDGTTLFITTHHLADAERMCDQVAVINGGRLLATGSPQEVGRREEAAFEVRARGITDGLVARIAADARVLAATCDDDHLLLHLAPGVRPGDVLAPLHEAPVAIDGIREVRSSLEEAYLEMMQDAEQGRPA